MDHLLCHEPHLRAYLKNGAADVRRRRLFEKSHERTGSLPPWLCYFQARAIRKFPKWIRFALWLACTTYGLAEAPNASHSLEYKVKAAYLFNFTKYVEWPSSAFEKSEAPILIGILGQDPFGEVMEDTVADRRVGKRSVEVRRSRRIDELRNCHVIFICATEREKLARILGTLRGTYALTVSEIPQFCNSGGMVSFLLEKGVVRFDINLENAEQAGLKISARMLMTARNVLPSKAERSR
jgi:hypothetical protein